MKTQTTNSAVSATALALLPVVVATSMLLMTTLVLAQDTTTTDPCFFDNVQLRNAVVEYAVDSSITSEVSTKHGWPIGAWCVGNVTDFHDVFYLVDINEDISSWDMSSATTLANMFGNNSAFNQDISSWASFALVCCLSLLDK
jgi:Mycoplasma protein of unknown function, DUF285